jgi:transcriptional regulator with PAS, ATPase and Fis domain
MLGEKVKQLPLQPQNLLEEVFEEVSTVLEELQVAQEELLQQNQELVTARQAVEAQRQRYQDLFDFAPDAYLVTDVAGNIQEANCTAAMLLNTSKELLAGKQLVSFAASGRTSNLSFPTQAARQQDRLGSGMGSALVPL